MADDYEYVLFIDEAGDDGLTRVKPVDVNGASEWLVIGAVLVRKSKEDRLAEWLETIRTDINSLQSSTLHYKKLSPRKRLRACELLAEKDCVFFSIASNKKNMRGHRNERAEQKNSTQWYYNFCVRLLMERVTDFCYKDCQLKHGKAKKIKVLFSKRGGHSYGQTKAYWELLKAQAAGNSTFLKRRQIRHQMLAFKLVDYVPHYLNPGLQLADIVASATYQAVETTGKNWSLEPIKKLTDRFPKEAGSAADYGFVLQPTPPEKADLNNDQKIIFEHFGYKFRST